jgi:predicted homoserine dehydrogenase-like protein
MIIVDKYLKEKEKDKKPIRVGLWGAGAMAKGMVNQIMRYTPGMEVAVIANRTIEKAINIYEIVGEQAGIFNDKESLQEVISSGGFAVTTNAELLCEVDGLDLLVECTGTIEYAANLIFKAIKNKKHVLLFNAEVDATIGPILKVYADEAGVMLSGCEGDQPGLIMNLFRYVKGLGLNPLICGNIKGLQDFYRNPTTQASFAAQWQQSPQMVTSFADGSKISIEQACVANATGMGVAKRGMYGYNYSGHLDEMVKMYDVEELKKYGGIVDFVVGAKPAPGVFVFGATDDPIIQQGLHYMKLGAGPLYSFYIPYHLTFFEIANSIARMVLFNDVIMAPIGKPVVEVITYAKTDLKSGKILDGIGGYDVYGQCENAAIVQEEKLLPIGLAEGAKLKKNISRDAVITFKDVELNESLLVYKLYKEQSKHFFKSF